MRRFVASFFALGVGILVSGPWQALQGYVSAGKGHENNGPSSLITSTGDGCTNAVTDYGFVGDGATDNASQWSTLASAVTAGTVKCVFFAPGAYRSTACGTSFTIPGPLGSFTLIGAGIQNTRFLFTCATGSGAFTFTASQAVTMGTGNNLTLRDFQMICLKAGCGTAISFDGKYQNGQNSRPVTIDSVDIREDGTGSFYWNKGIYLFNASGVYLNNVTLFSCNNAGTPCLQGTAIHWRSPLATISNVRDNGSGKVRLTVDSAAEFFTGMFGRVSKVNGAGYVNGTTTFTVVNSTTIDLLSVNYNSAMPYTSGGIMGTIPVGLQIANSGASYFNIGVLVDGFHVEGTQLLNTSMSFMQYSAAFQTTDISTDCAVTGGSYTAQSAGITLTNCARGAIYNAWISNSPGAAANLVFVNNSDGSTLTGNRLICDGSGNNGLVVSNTQTVAATGNTATSCATSYWLQSGAGGVFLFGNRSFNALFADVLDSGSGNYTKCNGSGAGAGTGTAACP